MTKQELINSIRATIKPNGNQEITAEKLQGLMTSTVDLAATEDELELKANQDYVDNIKNAVDVLHSDVESIQDSKADKTSIPTKTSQLTNDSGYATQTYVTAGLATKADKDSLASLENDITNLQTKNSNQDKSIAANSDAIQDLATSKQDNLESGVNIKTVNGQSLLGEGNITIEGGGSSVTVDDALSDTSTNPVQNKVITAKVNSLTQTSSQTVTKLAALESTVSDNTEAIATKADTSAIPTKTSQLTNDSTYQTKANLDTALTSYATKESVTALNGDITAIQTKDTDQDKAIKANSDAISELDTKVTQNTTAIATKADTSAIPTKTSQLTNDSDYVKATEVSTTYATKASVTTLQTEVNSKADSADLPTKTSQLTNDSTFQTKANLDTALESYATKASLDTLSATVTTQGQSIASIQTEIGDINTQLTEING